MEIILYLLNYLHSGHCVYRSLTTTIYSAFFFEQGGGNLPKTPP